MISMDIIYMIGNKEYILITPKKGRAWKNSFKRC
jgi:hypothetical protein